MHILTGLFLGEMLLGHGLLSAKGAGALPYKLIHSLPGRVRFRVDLMKGDNVMTRRLTHQLTAVSGVDEVQADSRTGSVLLRFKDRKETREALVKVLSEVTGAAEKARPDAPTGEPLLRQRLQQASGQLNRGMMAETGGLIDLSTLLALAAFVWGGKILIAPGDTSRYRGLTLLYWSYNMLRRP